MNNRYGRAKFKNFRTLLDSGCISMNLVERLVERLPLEKDAVTKWHTQARNITTNYKVKLDFT